MTTTDVATKRTLERAPGRSRPRFDELVGISDIAVGSSDGGPPSAHAQPQRARTRLPLAERHALRDGIAYAVDAPEGEIGFVTDVRLAPFEYWPDELIVESPRGARLRVPVGAVSAVRRGEGRLLLAQAPSGAKPFARAPEPRLTAALAWRMAAAAGAVLGLGGYIATFVALALDTGVTWGPALAASGAAAGAAAGASWRKAGRSWLAAAGLGSFWFPLAVGAILSLVLIFR